MCLGFRVWGLGFRAVQGLEFRGLGFRVSGGGRRGSGLSTTLQGTLTRGVMVVYRLYFRFTGAWLGFQGFEAYCFQQTCPKPAKRQQIPAARLLLLSLQMLCDGHAQDRYYLSPHACLYHSRRPSRATFASTCYNDDDELSGPTRPTLELQQDCAHPTVLKVTLPSTQTTRYDCELALACSSSAAAVDGKTLERPLVSY